MVRIGKTRQIELPQKMVSKGLLLRILLGKIGIGRCAGNGRCGGGQGILPGCVYCEIIVAVLVWRCLGEIEVLLIRGIALSLKQCVGLEGFFNRLL